MTLPYLDIALTGQTLNESQMQVAVRALMEGRVAEEDIGAFLVALAERGETVDEITGAAQVLREKAALIKAPPHSVDCCGTGGDGHGTYNVSTAVAFIAAACGVPVAKHGNRAASSRAGAADTLEEAGINLDLSLSQCEEALKEIGFSFLMAPHHHQAMKHVARIRKKLGRRTIFNLLGPLANPAGTKCQLIGVFDPKWLEPLAEALSRLGSEKAWIVHGHDGLDEITITGPTAVACLEGGRITKATLHPEDFGLSPRSLEEIKGGDAKENAAALKALLEGEPSAYRDIALMNSAAVLMIAGRASDHAAATSIAAQALDSGKAAEIFSRYRGFSNQ